MKILLTGSKGQLGQQICQDCPAEIELFACDHQQLDITDTKAVDHLFTTQVFDFVINAAAYTAVDKAESNTDLAFAVNRDGAGLLARACVQAAIPLIHISTDYVFDGALNRAYTETDTPNPINTYGDSKWQGEQAVQQQIEQHIILRVSGVFSQHGNNIVNTILRLAQERETLNFVSDQYTCPTYTQDIAQTLFQIIKQLHAGNTHWGIYHFCNAEPTSWYEFAQAIIAQARSKQKPIVLRSLSAITSEDFNSAAQRPMNSVLNCEKILRDYSIKNRPWSEALQDFFN